MLVTITDLGQFGIIRDVPPHRLPPNAWSEGHNVVFEAQGIAKRPGAKLALTPMVAPYAFQQAAYGSENLWLYAGLADVYGFDGTTHAKINKSGTTYTPTNGLLGHHELQ